LVVGPLYFFYFFFQAEDGIRDRNVTGVQTCALPISLSRTYNEIGTSGFVRSNHDNGKSARKSGTAMPSPKVLRTQRSGRSSARRDRKSVVWERVERLVVEGLSKKNKRIIML